MLKNATKQYDIFDDLESLLWVIVLTALRLFAHKNTFNAAFFDEYIEQKGGCSGRTITGGDLKALILSGGTVVVFGCPSLDAFLRSFIGFHAQRFNKVNDARNSPTRETEDALVEHTKEIESDLYQILHHFDTVLEDPEGDWKVTLVDPLKRNTPTVKELAREIRREQEQRLIDGWEGPPGKKQKDKAKPTRRARQTKVSGHPDDANSAQVDQAQSTRQESRQLATITETEDGIEDEAEDERQVLELLGGATTQTRYLLRPRTKTLPSN